MILRLALRELWHVKAALLLQVASLTVAIAALGASAHLHAQTQGGSIPGSTCGDQVLELAAVDNAGRPFQGWNPRQMQALMQGMGGSPAAASMQTAATISTRHGPEQITVEVVGPDYFHVLCVPRRNPLGGLVQTPFTAGAVMDASFSSTLPGLRDVRVDATFLGIGATTSGFFGTRYKGNPVKAWVPLSLVDRGADFLSMNSPLIHIFIRSGPSESVHEIKTRLDAVISTQPSLFHGITSVRLGPALQINAWLADKIAMVTAMLRLFAAALALLAAVNLMTYHFGRLPGAQAQANTLAAIGVPPAVVAGYAAIEPIVVGLLSFAAGSVLSFPLGRMALASVTNDAPSVALQGGWPAFAAALAITTLVTGALAFLRGWAMTRRQAPTKNRAQRLLLGWLPWLLMLQVALAGLTLTLAAQATAGLYKALPPLPNFPLEGLSVVEVDLDAGSAPQRNIQLRWASTWADKRPMGYDAALATSTSPFLPNGGMLAVLAHGNQTTQGWTQYVTANFFDVLGSPVPGAHLLAQDADPQTPKQSRGITLHIVLSQLAATKLLGDTSPEGAVLRYSKDRGVHPGASSPAAVVVGVLDDGIIGARGAVGKFKRGQKSMQAQVPMVYQTLASVDSNPGGLYVFVRHPPAATQSEISNAVMPAVHEIFPRATVNQIASAISLYRAPLQKERAMALVLALLAAASLAIGLLGMISLMTMLLRSLKVELAVRYAVGATRKQAAKQIARRLVKPAAVGLAMGALPAIAGVYLLGETLETAERAGLWGPAIGLLAMAAATGAVVVYSARIVTDVNFMDWLRYE